jgi:hypothetical protein
MMSSVLRQVLPIVVAGIDADATVLVAAAFLFSSLVVDSPNFSLVLALAAIARASRLLVFDSIRVGAPMSIVSDVWLIVKRFVNMGMLDWEVPISVLRFLIGLSEGIGLGEGLASVAALSSLLLSLWQPSPSAMACTVFIALLYILLLCGWERWLSREVSESLAAPAVPWRPEDLESSGGEFDGIIPSPAIVLLEMDDAGEDEDDFDFGDWRLKLLI